MEVEIMLNLNSLHMPTFLEYEFKLNTNNQHP